MNTAPRVLIRVEGGGAIGLGHLTRCLALAAALRKQGAQVHFLTQTTEPKLLDKIKAAGCTVSRAPAGSDAAFLIKRARTLGSSAVVTDSYTLPRDYHRCVRKAGLRVLAIVDSAAQPHDADLVLNQNLGAHGVDLSGPKYALLRPSFIRARGNAKPKGRPRILIMMGGSDPRQVTTQALKALDGLENEFRIDVVAGAGYGRISELAASVKKASHQTRLHHDPSGIARLMSRATIAISAAGSACWELACLGVPAVLLVLAENQEVVAAGLERAGFALSLGKASPFPMADLRSAVSELLTDRARLIKMGAAGRRLVDGEGAGRVADALLA
ncbi:MAG: UDP-2,4-diacetamido-2,4,6-trideoxy-beta-L-altropyranose hydrolase [Elusimicrobia bacterium]|nr:UDP-2,4-diacetamido-2,4,6-trideoxy-beta-L-altropyranose hydrolase [Elusimicrobiota bacterium]